MGVKLVTSQQYAEHVIRAVQRAKSRVRVLALIIEQDKDTTRIINALVSAAARGVDVSVLIDASTYSYTNGHINPLYGVIHPLKSARHISNRLRAHGATVHWLGAYNSFLFAGRTHSKWIVADDTVFCFGGINLHGSFETDNDFMLMMRDRTVADSITNEHAAIISANDTDSGYLSKSISTEYGEILFDGGIPFDSLIYRKATRLIAQASTVLIVTQYCPTGSLARAVAARDNRVYYNRPKTSDGLTNALISYGERRTGITNLYGRDQYIHAKFLIATLPDGQKVAITGSHNFISYSGVLGTREVALMTSDVKIIDELEKYFNDHIA